MSFAGGCQKLQLVVCPEPFSPTTPQHAVLRWSDEKFILPMQAYG